MNITNNIYKLALPFCVMLLVACSSDDETAIESSSIPVTPSNNQMSFSAGIEKDNTTRTSTSDNGDDTWSTVWSANESIDIFNVLNNNATGIFSSTADSEGKDVATFTGNQIANQGEGGNKFYALYPSGTTFTPSDNKMGANIPVIQPAYDGVNPAYQFMTACSTTSSLSFKNVCSLVKIQIESSSDLSIGVIKIVSNNGEKIAGDFTATINDNGTTTIASATSTFVEIRKTINGDGKAELDNGTYYIAVLPTVLSKGFTLYLEDVTNNKVYQRVANATSGYEFKRSEVTDLGSYSSSNYGSKIISNVVDLGLPSGTLWATKNISEGSREGNNKTTSFVSNTTDVGGYFAWGEIATKSGIYVWGNTSENYKYGRGANVSGNNTFNPSIGQGYLSRYNSSTNYQTRWFNNNTTTPPDYVEQLAAEDDVAYLTDNNFCIPMYNQADELFKNTTRTKSGSTFVLTGKTNGYTGRTMDLPAAGYKGDYILQTPILGYMHNESNACYWTKERANEAQYSYLANCFDVSSASSVTIGGEFRSEGRLIRPVVLNKAFAPVKTYQLLCEEAAEAQNNQ